MLRYRQNEHTPTSFCPIFIIIIPALMSGRAEASKFSLIIRLSKLRRADIMDKV